MGAQNIGTTSTYQGADVVAAKRAKQGAETVQSFLAYMQMTPAQRWEEAWLKSHGLTKKDLEDMTPEKRQAVMNQMAEDIKRQIEMATEKKEAANSGA